VCWSSPTAPSSFFCLSAAPLRGCVGPSHPLICSILSIPSLRSCGGSHTRQVLIPLTLCLHPYPIDHPPAHRFVSLSLVVLVLSLGRPAPSHSLYTLMLSCSLYTLSTLSFHSIPLCSPCVDPFSWLGSRPLVPLIPSTPSCSTPSRFAGNLSRPFHFSPSITHAFYTLSSPVPSYTKRYPLLPSRLSNTEKSILSACLFLRLPPLPSKTPHVPLTPIFSPPNFAAF
jgi:hypothetical protein